MNPQQQQREKLIGETLTSLKRVQDFDTTTLARTEELGTALNFRDALEPANNLIALYRQIAPEVLSEFSTTRLNQVKNSANTDFNRFDQILKFSTGSGNPTGERQGLLDQLRNGYEEAFEQLWPAIAYSVRRSTDFGRMERDARAAIQSISDRTDEMEAALQKKNEEAENALNAIRKVAAEQGVSQQAIYFKNESDEHSNDAKTWLIATGVLTGIVLLSAIGTLFLHKWAWIAPANPYEAAQLVVSKILIFTTLAFFLALSSRNYMSHRHNAVVNRHRQNSLVTYKALVEAAGDAANRDIILTKAADTIFGSEATGFVKRDGSDSGSLSMVNVNPSIFKGASSTT